VGVVVALAALSSTVEHVYPDPPATAAVSLRWLALALPTFVALALCFTRPGIGIGAAAALFVVHRITGQPADVAILGLVVGLYAVMRSERRRWPALVGTGAAVVIGGTALIGSLGVLDAAGDVIGDALLFAVVALLGELARRRNERLAALEERAADLDYLRELRAAAAVAEERARMARELHDVLAHGVTAIVVQAGAARRAVRRRPQDAEAALASIEVTGREALDELRRLVGITRAEPGTSPQPSITDLEPLLRVPPVPVSLRVSGEPQHIDAGVDLTAYRVIQEALTNVRKHAVGATRAAVDLVWLPGMLQVVVTDDAPDNSCTGSQARQAAVGGFGLLGMRERVQMCGGTLDAGPQPGRPGWRVAATLPLVGAAALA